jgi:hypothetical protein
MSTTTTSHHRKSFQLYDALAGVLATESANSPLDPATILEAAANLFAIALGVYCFSEDQDVREILIEELAKKIIEHAEEIAAKACCTSSLQ